MPQFHCNLGQNPVHFDHFWEHTVGSGHALLALRADWQAQLWRCHQELGFQYVRFHGLLSDEMGTLICHQNKFLYSFFNIDQIFDYLLSIGMRPFVELSFMPTALASGDQTVFNYHANVTPPQDYGQWRTLISKLVQHWTARYGMNEVRQWYFEVWNEPNLSAFWSGSQADYFELYRHTVEPIKAVDPALRVGGPATAKNEWVEPFLTFCDRNHLPVDFVTTHHYPTDALGAEGDDTETQLAQSQRRILRRQAQTVQQQSRGRPVYYTEWNSSSNPRDARHDEPYSAAFITKTIMEARGLVAGYSFWTFSDIFAENYFPSRPFHGGFGLLNLYGIPKPTYRAYELLHQLGHELLTVEGTHATVDGWAVRKGQSVTLLLTNHALPRHPIQREQLQIRLTGAQSPQRTSIRRIDAEHANPVAVWRQLGEPDYLRAAEVELLEAASRLIPEPIVPRYEDGAVYLDLDLPPHAVAAITVEFAADGADEQP